MDSRLATVPSHTIWPQATGYSLFSGSTPKPNIVHKSSSVTEMGVRFDGHIVGIVDHSHEIAKQSWH